MTVYVVMFSNWDDELGVERLYAIYANEKDANDFVTFTNAKNSIYSTTYWVDELEVL